MVLKKKVKNVVAYYFYSRKKNANGMLRNLKELNKEVNNANLLFIQANLEYQKKAYKSSINTLNKILELIPDNNDLLKESFLLLGDNYYQICDYTNSYEFYLKSLSGTEKDDYIYYSIAKVLFIKEKYHEALNILYKIPNTYKNFNSEYLKFRIMKKIDHKSLLTQINVLLNKYNEILSANEISNLYYRKGNILSLENYEKSIIAYKKSVEVVYGYFTWKNLAELHEKNSNWLEAINAYKKEIEYTPNNDDIHFKMGKLYGEKFNDYKSGINHILIAIDYNTTLSPYYFYLAKYYYLIDNVSKAEFYLENAIARQQYHRSYNYKFLSKIKQKLGKEEEAMSLLKEAELFTKPVIASQGQYKNNINNIAVRYSYFWDYYKVNPKIIFYENMSGTSMMADPYAIFLDIINRDDDFIHVWALNSFDSIPKKFKRYNNIIFVKKNTDAYAKYLCIAKYLICNSTFSSFFTIKKEQKYLQTTHGIFYKAVGKDNESNPFGVAGSTRNLLQATHIIAPNKFMIEKEQDAYSIRDIHYGEIGLVGYPRVDLTLNLSDTRKKEIMTSLNIDNSKDVLSYLPTWRGESKNNTEFEIERLLSDLKEISKLNINIIYRGHPITGKLLKDIQLPKNIIIPNKDISTNELLAITDICVSDYSSVFFDFIPTKKPIIHYVYDLEEYTNKRGLNLSEEELPGKVVKNQKDLIRAIKHYKINKKPSEHYLKIQKRFCPYDQGISSKKVVDWFLYNINAGVDIKRCNKAIKKELYILGNNISEERFKMIVQEILSKPKSKSSIMLKTSEWKNKNVSKELKLIRDKVNFIPYSGSPVFNIKEKSYISLISKQQESQLKDVRKIVNDAFNRELKRLLGNTSFDKVQLVDEEIQSTYWRYLTKSLIQK